MEYGREGWSMITYAGGAQDKTIINRIMLRFRPIAPKPAAGSEDPGLSPIDGKNPIVSKGRSKRKYVRARRHNKGYARKKTTTSRESAATLQLLPEKSDLDVSKGVVVEADENEVDNRNRLEANPGPQVKVRVLKDIEAASDDRSVSESRDPKVLEAWVTVEYVTGTCMEGCTDVGGMANLEGDTCPGFVSDGGNRVEWVNGAFKRMITRGEDEEVESSWEIRVGLVIKERIPYICSSFSCHVRVQYWSGKHKYSQMMPCDVCRMDGGGFAWRLDVEAALTLGR